MKTISILQTKGGAGKSLLATQLAAYLSKQGRTLLIDTDTVTRSASNWYSNRSVVCDMSQLGYALADNERDLSRLLKQATGFDYLVVDTSPRLTNVHRLLAESSDLALLPIEPIEASLIAQSSMLEMMETYETLHRVILNQHDKRYKRQLDEIAYIRKHRPFPVLETVMSVRAAYQAVTEGLFITETKDQGAIKELLNVFDEVEQLL